MSLPSDSRVCSKTNPESPAEQEAIGQTMGCLFSQRRQYLLIME